MQFQLASDLDPLEQMVLDDLGPDGLKRLAHALHADGIYSTFQRAMGFLSKCFNPFSDNGLHVKHLKRVIYASRGKATWLRALLLYQAEVQAEFEEEDALNDRRTMRPVRHQDIDSRKVG